MAHFSRVDTILRQITDYGENRSTIVLDDSKRSRLVEQLISRRGVDNTAVTRRGESRVAFKRGRLRSRLPGAGAPVALFIAISLTTETKTPQGGCSIALTLSIRRFAASSLSKRFFRSVSLCSRTLIFSLSLVFSFSRLGLPSASTC